MSREVKEDLADLVQFIERYNLTSITAQPGFKQNLTKPHKVYLALVTLLTEVEHQSKTSNKKVGRKLSATQVEYLTECASDVGSALFCWIHGAYKSCRMMMRSSIETFIKGATCAETPAVLTEKSVHRVLAIAKASTFFSGLEAKIFASIETIYAELCADVHTAGIANMAKLSALQYFPSFDAGKSLASSRVMTVLTQHYLTVLCVQLRDQYHAMHHRNKEVVSDVIPASLRARIHS